MVLKKVRLQPWGLLKVYDFKVYNWFYLPPSPHQLFCFIFDLGFLFLEEEVAHSSKLHRQGKKNRNHSDHRRPLSYWCRTLLHLFLPFKRPFVRTALLAWLRKADEKPRQCHYAWNNKGNREQQKVLKVILNAHFVNKATNVPLWSITSGASSTKENNKFRSVVMLVKLCQNPSIGW